MDKVSSLSLSSTINLHINRVRLYLGVTSLANIVNGEGTHIMRWALVGSKRAHLTIPWPNQERPSEYSWSIWRRHLRQLFTQLPRYTRSDKNWRLTSPLGSWLPGLSYTFRDFYYSLDTSSIFVKQGNCYREYTKAPNRLTLYTPTENTVSTLPNTVIPTAASWFGIRLSSIYSIDRELTDLQHSSPTTFEDYISSQPHHLKRILGTLLAEEVDIDFWISALQQ
eukprot:10152916-Ditylum_brightwellii.AAC.1